MVTDDFTKNKIDNLEKLIIVLKSVHDYNGPQSKEPLKIS